MNDANDRTHRLAADRGIVKPQKLAHIVRRTSRFDELVRWYCTVLGAEVVHSDGMLAFLTYDDERRIVVDPGVAVDLQVRERPALVEDAEAHLAGARDRLRLCPTAHRRDQELVLVGRDVVDDRHRGPIGTPRIPEDAGSMRADELAALGRSHVAVSRGGQGLLG